MLESLEIFKVKPQNHIEAESVNLPANVPVDMPFVGLTQEELDIIRWEGEGGQ